MCLINCQADSHKPDRSSPRPLRNPNGPRRGPDSIRGASELDALMKQEIK